MKKASTPKPSQVTKNKGKHAKEKKKKDVDDENRDNLGDGE